MWVLMCNLEVFKPKNRTEMYPHWLFTLTTPENITELSDKSMGFYQDYDHYNNVRYTRRQCAWPTQVSQYLENYRRQTQISPRTPGTASWLSLGQNCSPANSSTTTRQHPRTLLWLLPESLYWVLKPKTAVKLGFLLSPFAVNTSPVWHIPY